MFSLETLDRLFRRKSDNTLNAIFRKIIEGLKQTDSIGNPVAPDNYIFPHLDGTESSERIKNKTQYLTRIINRRMAQISEQLGIPHVSTNVARHSITNHAK